jgi:hypothetical protein
MNSLSRFLMALLMVCFCLCAVGEAQENVKLAQTGMQFLSVVSDARAAALANAVTTLPMGSGSLFFNPACMTESDLLDVSASRNEWIADIRHTTFSLSVKPAQGDYGVFGISVQTVDYGEIIGTVVANNDQGYLDYKDLGMPNPDPKGLAIGVGYAKALNDKFSVGVQVRWVKQDLGESILPVDTSSSTTTGNKVNPLVFDFGTLFKTGFKSLTFGMSVRNFSKEVTFATEAFELPLTFTLGVSMDLMNFLGDTSIVRSVLVAIDAVHNRDYREQLFAGLEVNLFDVLALRGGIITNSDENAGTFGLGVHQYGLAIDYAYTPFGIFDKVQRFTVRFSM